MYRLARSVRILCFAESTWYYTRSWVWCVLGNACYVWVVYCKGIVDLPDQCPSLGTSATNEALSDPPATTWAAYQVSNIATIITMATIITIIADSIADFVRVCQKNRKWQAFPNLKCYQQTMCRRFANKVQNCNKKKKIERFRRWPEWWDIPYFLEFITKTEITDSIKYCY